ncbi:MAG: DUF4920 domain-containing protein [Deltaproteobacteria bacterium]|nr:DUF4920 domain-containing protein [Deltaproteobacteria bacterium]NCP02383.1 DUF4920 domain-containing protein [Deltaproteobacteria bacterium]
MSKNLTLILTLCLFFVGSHQALAKTFGAGLSLEKTIAVSELLEKGDTYVGKQVQVQGMIVDVCQTRGCWMYIAGDKPFEKIRIKVNDGEIVFPLEARGQKAKVEGVVEKFDLSREEVIERRRHHAEEKGEDFDPATVTKGETFFQIRGTGAEIEGI